TDCDVRLNDLAVGRIELVSDEGQEILVEVRRRFGNRSGRSWGRRWNQRCAARTAPGACDHRWRLYAAAVLHLLRYDAQERFHRLVLYTHGPDGLRETRGWNLAPHVRLFHSEGAANPGDSAWDQLRRYYGRPGNIVG